MREIRQSGSEGGEAGNLTGLPYPYHGTRSLPILRLPLAADQAGLQAAAVAIVEYAAVGDGHAQALAGVQVRTGAQESNGPGVRHVNHVQVGAEDVGAVERETGAAVALGQSVVMTLPVCLSSR